MTGQLQKSPVSFLKSIDKSIPDGYNTQACLRECWNGRQARLRCVWLCRVGSSPISRTITDTVIDTIVSVTVSVFLLDHSAILQERRTVFQHLTKRGDEMLL